MRIYMGIYSHISGVYMHVCDFEHVSIYTSTLMRILVKIICMCDIRMSVKNRDQAFTGVSFREVHVDSKVFVRQHLYGTGSYLSTLDCIRDRSIFRRARFWSLDGVFQDDVDPEWVFWQRESEIKHQLYGDWIGKASARKRPNTPQDGAGLGAKKQKTSQINVSNSLGGKGGLRSRIVQQHKGKIQTTLQLNPSGKIAGSTGTNKTLMSVSAGTPSKLHEAYSKKNFSTRIGLFVQDSPQKLARIKRDWLAMASKHNLGPPTAMTTVVANAHTSDIYAHNNRGPCAQPDAEHTLTNFLRGKAMVKFRGSACVEVARTIVFLFEHHMCAFVR